MLAELSLGVLGIALGVVALLDGIFSLITGILGYRASRGEAGCAGKAKTLGSISLVVMALVNFFSLWGSNSTVSLCHALLSIALQILFLCFVGKAQREETRTLHS